MYFVYRSHYEGPLSKHVRHLPGVGVLDWFRLGWTVEDPEEWVEEQLGVDVYGLDSIFEEAVRRQLDPPRDWRELHDLLCEHLYLEGEPETHLRVTEHSVRAYTDDDEVELAYFLLDDEVPAAAPDRLAYLFQSWPLPAEVTAPESPDTAFVPAVPTQPAMPPAGGAGATYAVLLTFYDGASIATTPAQVFPGVRLPGLAARLRAGLVAPGRPDPDWPPELKVLALLLDPADESIEPALRRAVEWPGFHGPIWEPWPELPDGADDTDPVAARRAALPPMPADAHPDRSLLLVSAHLAQLAMYTDEVFGYQQWFFFDDLWAGSHPDLAQSLLRYASHWDPLG
ncbi:hypothetical protein [Plantactinospora sp. BB1]|uniref:hypothetical protein n=1 Tax=Plantactinospora sp. BB1 TaxID=2071627 RepID=UPI00131F1E28|nr:hypothetical protein [Plantactinospora sp. BB1]